MMDLRAAARPMPMRRPSRKSQPKHRLNAWERPILQATPRANTSAGRTRQLMAWHVRETPRRGVLSIRRKRERTCCRGSRTASLEIAAAVTAAVRVTMTPAQRERQVYSLSHSMPIYIYIVSKLIKFSILFYFSKDFLACT